MHITAHAKINWSLAVVGLREDGYHLLDMLMQTVDCGDILEITPADALSLRIEGAIAIDGPPERNLVLRAARLLQAETGTNRGAMIRLEKRISVGSGLGGGSADAAATLLALCSLWGIALEDTALASIALRLGADVPFFLASGLARVCGIGERIQPLAPAPAWPLVLVQAGAGLSTPAVFQRYDANPPPETAPTADALQAALLAGDRKAAAALLQNDLQQSATALRPEIARCAAALEKAGALKAWMTGSGSVVAGLFESMAAAKRAAEALAPRWPWCVATQSLGTAGRRPAPR